MHKIQFDEKIDGCYVYLLLDPSTNPVVYNGVEFPHTPFYLGKGKKLRVFGHVKEAMSKTRNARKSNNRKVNSHKINKILKIINAGLEVVHFILIDNLTDEAALKIEGEWGDILGYQFDGSGILTNLTKTGTVNPILFGEKNGFFNKKHTEETKKKIAEAYARWFAALSDERKQEMNEKRSRKRKGIPRPRDQVLKMVQTRCGPDYKEIGQARKERRIKMEARRKIVLEKRRIKQAEKIRLSEIKEFKKQNGTYWEEIRGGCKNPMYGKGELLAGPKNGRAKIQLITILEHQFLVHGNFKLFVRDLKKLLKCKNPFVSKKSAAILKPNIVELSEIPLNSSFIKYAGEDSLKFLGEIYARMRNQKH